MAEEEADHMVSLTSLSIIGWSIIAYHNQPNNFCTAMSRGLAHTEHAHYHAAHYVIMRNNNTGRSTDA